MAPKLTSEQIIALIQEATVKEELAIPLYDSHISAALFWSGLPQEVQSEILAGLKILTRESRGHVKILKRVEALVRRDAKSRPAIRTTARASKKHV